MSGSETWGCATLSAKTLTTTSSLDRARGICAPRSSWYWDLHILCSWTKLIYSCSPRALVCNLPGIPEWTMPRLAVTHCKSPGPMVFFCSAKSSYWTCPSSMSCQSRIRCSGDQKRLHSCRSVNSLSIRKRSWLRNSGLPMDQWTRSPVPSDCSLERTAFVMDLGREVEVVVILGCCLIVGIARRREVVVWVGVMMKTAIVIAWGYEVSYCWWRGELCWMPNTFCCSSVNEKWLSLASVRFRTHSTIKHGYIYLTQQQVSLKDRSQSQMMSESPEQP